MLSTEIRLQILKELDSNDLLGTALVCKLWSGLAIDTMWKNLPIRLTHLIVPFLDYFELDSFISDPLFPWNGGGLNWTVQEKSLALLSI
ncbi:hypothetical protein FRB94_004910 [Tulasnella sp. JGI-2019a]|nr:hypothetical protein FRB93_005566 [Tulasnella sp. JGI-2019a]KAG9001112.1 hypothetical protein FRB94_004910 [Tulasnella sp. JGI-2019a]KAG9025962.1 hypothetical protein FRB95_009548 [Tulasnella sp. JGI-2019a]